MKLIDPHCHCAPLSKCAIIDGKRAININKAAGINGMVLTNHFDPYHLLENETKEEFAKRYVDCYYENKKYADSIGFDLFFGIEVTLINEGWVHILLFGLEPDFVFKHNNLYELSLSELRQIVLENNGMMIQAHPFRNNVNQLVNTKYIDGVEANCAINFEGHHIDEIIQVANDNNITVVAGGDYHGNTYKTRVGTYVPRSIKTSQELKNYLLGRKEVFISIAANYEAAHDLHINLK